MRSILLVGLFLVMPSAFAAGVTIDFEELAPSSDPSSNLGPIVSDGFSFATESGFVVGEGLGFPTQGLFFCPGCTLTLEDISGDAFRLNQLDYSAPGAGNETISVTGFYEGGGSVTRNLLISGAVRSFQFGIEWDNLTRVVFDGTSNAFANGIDNVVLNTVPIPAAAWLFGSALAGLGWMRRRSAG